MDKLVYFNSGIVKAILIKNYAGQDINQIKQEAEELALEDIPPLKRRDINYY